MRAFFLYISNILTVQVKNNDEKSGSLKAAAAELSRQKKIRKYAIQCINPNHGSMIRFWNELYRTQSGQILQIWGSLKRNKT